jgi:peptide/nickel transport system substrate-binding protein
MNRLDHAVIGGLVLVLALIAVAIGVPAFLPSSSANPSAGPSLKPAVPYREGAIGRPVSVNPLAARTQVDRDLVALTFSGLLKLGPDGMLIPDLASRWTTDESGKTWTFTLRPDTQWHDGKPLTAHDVVFTIDVLRDPTYTGPGAGSWREVTPTAVDTRTVRFDLTTPLGGFAQLATQPIAPAHLLSGVPVAELIDDAFGRTPVGSGSFAVVELDDEHAVLEPAAKALTRNGGGSQPGGSADPPTDAFATSGPTKRPAIPQPKLSRLEFRYFDDAATLERAFEAGEVDAISGLSPAQAGDFLRTAAGARALRSPGTTLTTVLLNLRLDHPELRDPAVRSALLAALDRPGIVDTVFGGMGNQADSPIPPSSWAFDRLASSPVAHDPAAAAAALTKAGWTKVDDRWRPAKAKEPYTIELLGPDAEMNPTLNAIAKRVAADWEALGFTVTLVEIDPGSSLTERLREGKFSAAVLDISIGLDPDLYPLLASSQTRSGGLNLIGLQDPTLDGLLSAARKPGDVVARKAAYTALQKQLTTSQFVLPLAFADEVVVAGNHVRDVVVQPVGDPSDRFYDVLTWRLANDR